MEKNISKSKTEDTMTITFNVPEIVAKNIKWDCDEDDPKDLGLPADINIPASVIQKMIDDYKEEVIYLFIELINNLENNSETISDYISDKTGFCHEGFEIDTSK